MSFAGKTGTDQKRDRRIRSEVFLIVVINKT